MTRFFLGIDGGQSSTSAVIGNQFGEIVGSGRGGPCNHVEGPGGRQKFIDAIQASVWQACEQAGLAADSLEFDRVCGGFSGGSADKAELLATIIRASAIDLSHDALIALSGATAGAPGIVTIAGTGTISYGRNADRRTARVGGWGFLFGDEGGGFDLARQAVRAILRHEEGWGPPTDLTPILLRETQSTTANELMHRLYSNAFTRPRIAGLSVLVDQAASAGDAVARSLLLNAAQQLAATTATTRAQLFRPGEQARVAYIGGVFNSSILLERFQMSVESEDGNEVIRPLHGPATGALLEAYAAAGIQVVLRGVPAVEKQG